MRLMFGEMLDELKRMNFDEKVLFLKKNRSKLTDDIIITFLVNDTKWKIENPARLKFNSNLYNPDRMTHLYPEFNRFKRIFIERSDVPIHILDKAFLNLVQYIPLTEANFIIEAIETGKNDIITSEVIEKVYPELFEVQDASIPVSM